MSPLFSVVVAAYEHEAFVEEMARSVLSQTLEDLELIVVEDGSADATLEILQGVADDDPRMTVLHHPGHENGGLIPSLLLAMEHATGRYVGVLGSDDRWAADKLEHQLPALEDGALLVYGRARIIDEHGVRLPGRVAGRPPSDLDLPLHEALLAFNSVPAMTAVFPRRAYDEVGGYDPAETYEDLGLWVRLAVAGSGAFIDRVLGDYRVREQGMMLGHVAAGVDLLGVIRTIEVIARGSRVPVAHRPAVESWLRCWMAVGFLVYGEEPEALSRLEPEDAPRLKRLIHEWRPRIVSVTDPEVRHGWIRRVAALGAAFEEAVGSMVASDEGPVLGRGTQSPLSGRQDGSREPFGRIDAPSEGEAVWRRWLDVRGWALDPSGPLREILIEIAGRQVATARMRLPRVDVHAAYPWIEGARTSGWLARVDLEGLGPSRLDLAAVAVRKDGGRVEVQRVQIDANAVRSRQVRSDVAPVDPQGEVAVYTAIFGGYDDLLSQPEVPGVEYICFTDDPTLESDQWLIRVEDPRHPHPRMAAKWHKVFPHRALRAYRRSIWIDGSVRLAEPGSITKLLSFLGSTGIAAFPHPDRGDIYEEAQVSRAMSKYEGLPLLEQVDAYRREGLPDDHRLYAGGVLVRDVSVRKVRRLGRLWWREIVRWTYQDQLSLPYVLWKLGLEPAEVPYSLWMNPLIEHDVSTRRFEDR